MKWTFSFLAAALAAFAAAAPRASMGDVIGIPNDYQESAFPVTPEAIGALAKRNDSTTLTASNLTTSNSNLLKLVGIKDRGPLTGQYAVDMRMGGAVQHVGTMRAQRLWDSVYNCLNQIGTPQNSNSRDPYFCKPGVRGCQKNCVIPNIVFDANANGRPDTPKYSNKGKLTVTAQWSEYHEDVHPGIKDLTYRLVANMYRLMTLQGDACYSVAFPHSRTYKICQILSKVLVAFPTNGGRSEAILNVEVTSSVQVYDSSLACANEVGPINGWFLDNVRSDLGNAMGWDPNDILPFVSCPADNCFETKQYEEGQPYADDPHCNTLAEIPLPQ